MMLNIVKLVALTGIVVSCLADKDNEHSRLANLETVLEWDWIQFQGQKHESANSSSNPRVTIIADMEIYKRNYILSLPRLRPGVAFTLATVDENKHDKSPRLRPFPDAKGQTVGDCRDLQSVLGIELDTQGRLWVLDTGAVNLFEEKPDWKCPAKLIIYDLKKLGHPEVVRYVFPEDVAIKGKSALLELALQKTGTGDKDWVAYISDSTEDAIIVFNLKKESSYRVEDKTMKPEKKAGLIEINKKKYDFGEFGVHGVTVDKNFDKVYYSILAGYKVYSIPGRVIRNKKLATNKKKLAHIVKLEGRKESQDDGLYSDSEGRVYIGLLEKNTASVWSPAYKLSPRTTIEMARDRPNQWISRLTIKGCWLYVVSNRKHQLKAGQYLKKGEINNRVSRVYIGTQSYVEYLGQAICPQPIPVGINWPQIQVSGHGGPRKHDNNEGKKDSGEEGSEQEESNEEGEEEQEQEEGNSGEESEE